VRAKGAETRKGSIDRIFRQANGNIDNRYLLHIRIIESRVSLPSPFDLPSSFPTSLVSPQRNKDLLMPLGGQAAPRTIRIPRPPSRILRPLNVSRSIEGAAAVASSEHVAANQGRSSRLGQKGCSSYRRKLFPLPSPPDASVFIRGRWIRRLEILGQEFRYQVRVTQPGGGGRTAQSGERRKRSAFAASKSESRDVGSRVMRDGILAICDQPPLRADTRAATHARTRDLRAKAGAVGFYVIQI